MKPLRHLLPLLLAGLLLNAAPAFAERTAGEVVDDAAITAKVNVEIARTEGVGKAVAVNVDTYLREVLLAGFVDNENQKRALEEAAKRVDGVEKVINSLHVKKR